MPSGAWKYFMDQFFGDPYMMWHDGVNPEAAANLEGEEREKAEAMLIDSLREGSHYAAMGLRELKSQKAVPVMKEIIGTGSAHGDLRIQIAIALNAIEETQSYIPDIIEALLQNESPYVRLKAAMELKRYHTPEVIEVLYKAVRDPDYLVRNHASESLLVLHGFERNISSHKEIFRNICYGLDKEGATKEKCINAWDTAAEMLQNLFISRKPQKTGEE